MSLDGLFDRTHRALLTLVFDAARTPEEEPNLQGAIPPDRRPPACQSSRAYWK